jgi:UDP-MurNAc hydroxylase
MHLEFITNASVIIRLTTGETILVDPWLHPAYNGSWYNFPPLSEAGLEKYLQFKPDYIHISHLHPDHLDPPTLAYYDKSTPIIIGKLPYPHLENRLRSLGFENIITFELNRSIPFLNGEINIWGDFHTMESDPEDRVAYSMDTSLWITDRDETSLLHVNDNVLTPDIAEQIVKLQGNPTVAIIPYSGASMYPHAFTNYTDEQKLLKKDELRARSLENLFLAVAEVLCPKYLVPAAGSYVMGGSLSKYNRYLHQATPQQVKDFWAEHSQLNSQVFFLQEGDILDTQVGSVNLNKKAPLRDFTEADRERYGETLAHIELDHEQISIPDSFEIPWVRLLSKARRNLWIRQEQLKLFPAAEVVLNLVDREEIVNSFSFAMDQESRKVGENQVNVDPDRYQITFTIDWRLMMMILLSSVIWNNLEIGALLTVDRKPDRYHPTVHSLMSYFVL